MAYEQTAFIKTKGGQKAPEGFHYMPSGGLMSDSDHIARYGYIEKTIKSIIIDISDISPSGGSKNIQITGDDGFIFSVEIYEGIKASYYNFKTKTWSAASYKQTNVYAPSGTYSSNIEFPSQSALKTFTINVYAETVENIKTKHIALSEVRYLDGSLNLNASTGSDSNVVTKVLYQDVIKNLFLSVTAPSKQHTSQGTVNGAVSTNRMILDQDATDPNIVQLGDVISCTGIAAALGVTVTKINPAGDNIHEIEMSAADVVSDGVTVVFAPAFKGILPNHIAGTTGRAVLEVVSGSSGSYPFSITMAAVASRGLSVTRLPVAEDLFFIHEITFGSNGVPITGEDIRDAVSGDPVFSRWPVTNIANLANGMALDPARRGTGINTTTPATVSYTHLTLPTNREV